MKLIMLWSFSDVILAPNMSLKPNFCGNADFSAYDRKSTKSAFFAKTGVQTRVQASSRPRKRPRMTQS